jgi:hypothetical protein
MTSDHESRAINPSEASLVSMRRAAEAAALATCDVGGETDVEDSLTALTAVIAELSISRTLIEAMEQAAVRSSTSMESLRIAVADLTRAHKADGASPEAVLITLKAVVNQHRLPLLPRYMADWSGDRLQATISTWCIDAYFKS